MVDFGDYDDNNYDNHCKGMRALFESRSWALTDDDDDDDHHHHCICKLLYVQAHHCNWGREHLVQMWIRIILEARTVLDGPIMVYFGDYYDNMTIMVKGWDDGDDEEEDDDDDDDVNTWLASESRSSTVFHRRLDSTGEAPRVSLSEEEKIS